jgi:hypothetical protein
MFKTKTSISVLCNNKEGMFVADADTNVSEAKEMILFFLKCVQEIEEKARVAQQEQEKAEEACQEKPE